MLNGSSVIYYNNNGFIKKTGIDEEFLNFDAAVGDVSNTSAGSDAGIAWADIGTLEDSDGIKSLCESLGIHRLIIEDILSPRQMVKMDIYGDCLFMVLKMPYYDPESLTIESEHVSIILKGRRVVSFQEKGGTVFTDIETDIREGRGGILKFGADYLCYEMLDIIIDRYFSVIDELGDLTDELEEEIISAPDRGTLKRIYYAKRQLMHLRKSVYPLRELVGKLTTNSAGMMSGDIRIYLHDVYDHLIQIVDSIETYQDILSNMLDTYLSSVSNKTNDTMKILTIFSTIFIPLTFLAGIYGMNFADIPELHLKYGYMIFWVVSLIIAGFMLLFFHRKKWF